MQSRLIFSCSVTQVGDIASLKRWWWWWLGTKMYLIPIVTFVMRAYERTKWDRTWESEWHSQAIKWFHCRRRRSVGRSSLFISFISFLAFLAWEPVKPNTKYDTAIDAFVKLSWPQNHNVYINWHWNSKQELLLPPVILLSIAWTSVIEKAHTFSSLPLLVVQFNTLGNNLKLLFIRTETDDSNSLPKSKHSEHSHKKWQHCHGATVLRCCRGNARKSFNNNVMETVLFPTRLTLLPVRFFPLSIALWELRAEFDLNDINGIHNFFNFILALACVMWFNLGKWICFRVDSS